jgi:2-polyprenyl-3-methyl-5-hydroxy-6-metoxy-1,4-benzoquinol methylase
MDNKRSFNPYDVVRKGYNSVAAAYDAQRDRWHSVDLLTRFTQLLPSGAKVLDVGCGSGVPVAQRLAELGYEVTGIDISESMLVLARQSVPRATLVCANMVEYQYPPATFDGIACCYALIHVPIEQHAEVLQKFAGALKPRGALLLSVGRNEWEGREDFHGSEMFWSHPTPDRSIEALQMAGFDIHFAQPVPIGGEEHFWIIGDKGI